MLIRVRELELRNLEFDENYQPGDIEFGPDFRQIGPLHTAGRAELIVEHRGHHQNVEDIAWWARWRRIWSSVARAAWSQ